MNAGEIVVHGRCGDAAGYGMRGGRILIRDDVGYRAGIHMKAYENHEPVLVIGADAGSFLGEYLAGGLILVLGIGPVSYTHLRTHKVAPDHRFVYDARMAAGGDLGPAL